MKKTLRSALALAAAVLLAGFAAAAPREPLNAVQEAAKNPKVKKALKAVDKNFDAMVEEWIKLAEISAPSGHEDARAEYLMQRFKDAGLINVRRDETGNVVGLLKGGKFTEKFIVLDAHLDTVVQPGAEVKVRREDGKLYGGGVGDDTAGLIGILYMLRAFQDAGLFLQRDVLVTATVQEEVGLKGAEAFVARMEDKIDMYVSVDGGFGSVSYGATSIYWYKFHFKAEGAHTLWSYGKPSTTHAAAKAIDALYAMSAAELPRDPEERRAWLNIGMLGGGEVPNAQCRDAWFSLDLRSNSPEVIAELEKKVMTIVQNAADEVGVALETEVVQKLEGAQIPGHENSEMVRTALDALREAGVKEPKASMLGSSNHNTAIKRGIPAINIGVTEGEGAHTPTEWVETEPARKGVKQLILLMSALAGVH